MCGLGASYSNFSQINNLGVSLMVAISWGPREFNTPKERMASDDFPSIRPGQGKVYPYI